MNYSKHYTREEARALLPEIKSWLASLSRLRVQLQKFEQQVGSLSAEGADTGGKSVNSWMRTLVAMQEVLLEFRKREIEVKDLDRGLLDFPAIRGGKEVFLCWELGEEDIEFWHDLDSGYAGRERL